MIHDYLYLWWKTKLSEIPEIKLVEMDFDQDSENTENQLISTPAILISFPGESPMDDLLDDCQEGEMQITLRLVTVNYRIKDDRIRKVGKVNHHDIARKVFNHINKVRKGLLSEITEFAALADTDDDWTMIQTQRRSSVEFDQRHSVYIRSSQTFTMRVLDFTANKAWVNHAATLQIDMLDLL